MPKSAGSKRPTLVLVSEETRHLCLLLAQALLRWPEVTTRPMFGLRAFYRGAVVFAMLPDKRALESPNAIGYKLADQWHSFDLTSEHDIEEALVRLNQAYVRAAGRR
jgi:hypothetical protein